MQNGNEQDKKKTTGTGAHPADSGNAGGTRQPASGSKARTVPAAGTVSAKKPASGKTAAKAGSTLKTGRPAVSSAPPRRNAAVNKTAAASRSAFAGKHTAADNMIKIRRALNITGKGTLRFTRQTASGFERFVNANEEEVQTSSRRRSPRRTIFTFGRFVVISLLLIAVFLIYYANKTITTNEVTVTVAGANSAFEGYRILLLSDLHGRTYGENQAVLLRAIEATNYDIVLITGDMVGASGDPKPFYQLLEGLGTSVPIYFIAGDSDQGPLLDTARPIEGTLNQIVLEEWVLGAIERGAVYLNKPTSIKVGSSTLWLSPGSMLNLNADDALKQAEYELDIQKKGVIGGIGVDYTTLPFTNYRYRQYTALKEAALYMEEDDLHITLSHYPLSEEVLAAAQVNAPAVENAYLMAPDLSVCGHYCGGVWRIPLFGAFYIPDTLAPRHGWFPDQSTVQGLHSSRSSSTMVYTSAGLGVTDYGLFPDIRLFNNPEITVITLTTTLTPDLLGQ